jgi:hypothetical protein
MASFDERISDLATQALGEQERQVAELRSRGATLLAGAAVKRDSLTPVYNTK